jgi:SAM-dependent methyltransferase
MSEMTLQARARARAVWSAGNWDEVSEMLPPAGERVLDLADVEPGMDVVDVGTGSGGTVAIPAALRGATVTGVDVTPELFDDAMRRAGEAGVDVSWVEGDAAELPLPDASFDRVLSTFGHAFAADHEAAGRELVRVCRPGGRIVAAMWTPEGLNGKMLGVVGRHMPPPPPGFRAPVLWGTEAHWVQLVAPLGVTLSFHRTTVRFHGPSLDDFQTRFEASFGPLVVAKAALGDAYGALSADLRELYAAGNTATDGSFSVDAEYLIAVGEVAA